VKRALYVATLAGGAAVVGCANVHDAGIVAPAPSPSASVTPGSCATPDGTDTNIVYVAMSSDMAPATDSSGNSIFGFAPYPDLATEGTVPQTSAVVPVTTGELVQFVNAEPSGSTISHSAVGFTTSAFPVVPYSFPPGSDTQIGTTITKAISPGTQTSWATGEVAPASSSVTGTACASQVFSASLTGTFYFGDFSTYNSAASMRGEIVVSR
jgi:hypothetical protein